MLEWPHPGNQLAHVADTLLHSVEKQATFTVVRHLVMYWPRRMHMSLATMLHLTHSGSGDCAGGYWKCDPDQHLF